MASLHVRVYDGAGLFGRLSDISAWNGAGFLTMSVQLLLSGLIVLLASCYLGRRACHAIWGRKKECSKGCICRNTSFPVKTPAASGAKLIENLELRRDYQDGNI